MLMQNLNAQLAQGEKDRDSKAEDKAKSLKAKADGKVIYGTLPPTPTRVRSLARLVVTCEQKAADQKRQLEGSANAEIDQLEASFAKLTEVIEELTNAWRQPKQPSEVTTG
jgi:hypothetical protein